MSRKCTHGVPRPRRRQVASPRAQRDDQHHGGEAGEREASPQFCGSIGGANAASPARRELVSLSALEVCGSVAQRHDSGWGSQ